jgi:CBS domain-containing protein
MEIDRSVREVPVTALELVPPLVCDAGASVREVIRTMRQHGRGCALLVSGDRLVGIFTERDVLQKVFGTVGALDLGVTSLMTPDPVCVGRDDPIRRAVYIMHDGGFRHVPIVDEEKRIVGLVRHKDIGRYMVQHYADRLLNLPPDPEQVARTPEGG